jgi:hypothetical protein
MNHGERHYLTGVDVVGHVPPVGTYERKFAEYIQAHLTRV